MHFFLKVQHRLSTLLKVGNDRSQRVMSNIIKSFFVKGGSILIGLLIIPLTIDYVNPTEYGIWLTISSIVTWLSFFDIGLGNGMRNKLSEALALDELNEAKKYVSTTYATMIIISLVILLVFAPLSYTVNWSSFLNISTHTNDTLHLVIFIVIASFCVQFVVRIINSILIAVHETALSGLITLLGQLGAFFGVLYLKYNVAPSLLILVITLTAIPTFILLLFTFYLFSSKLIKIAPSWRHIDLSILKSILSLGGGFFIIQIGALVLFQTDNFIITKVVNPEAVTEFNIVYKLFSIVSMISFIILTPYWSAYTDAWARKDYLWMRNNIILLRKIWLGLSVFSVFLYFISPHLYSIWIGPTIKISDSTSLAMMFYVVAIGFQGTHNYIINGIGKIKLQIYLMIIVSILNIPVSFYLGKKYGVPGVIYSNVIFISMMSIAFYFQVNKLLFNRLLPKIKF